MLLSIAVNCFTAWLGTPLHLQGVFEGVFWEIGGCTETITVFMKGVSGPASRENVFSGVYGGKTHKWYNFFYSF